MRRAIFSDDPGDFDLDGLIECIGDSWAKDVEHLQAENARLREALADQIRATAYAKLKRTDVVAMVERRGELMNHACPLARTALSHTEATKGDETDG